MLSPWQTFVFARNWALSTAVCRFVVARGLFFSVTVAPGECTLQVTGVKRLVFVATVTPGLHFWLDDSLHCCTVIVVVSMSH